MKARDKDAERTALADLSRHPGMAFLTEAWKERADSIAARILNRQTPASDYEQLRAQYSFATDTTPAGVLAARLEELRGHNTDSE